jgi:hypothetical protein
MDLRQIAEALAVPVTYLTGARGKPKLRVVSGGKPKPPVDKPTKPE